MKTYFCKSCNSSENWWLCKKCGKPFCIKCARDGQGGYTKMRSQNTCPLCGGVSTFGFEKVSRSDEIVSKIANARGF